MSNLFSRLFDVGEESEDNLTNLYQVVDGEIIWDRPYRFPDGSNRPKCLNIGCNDPVALSRGNESEKKNRTLRTLCNACHRAGYDKKKSLKDGVKSAKKGYCENVDGRLGYVCTALIMYPGQLELDHIDGNHINNIPKNVQTLCKNCHSYKGYKNGDFKKARN